MAISVAVPKNLSGIKTKVALNLTKRQLICFSGAGAVGIPFYIFTKGFIGTQASALLMVAVMLPFFFLAMYEKDGFPAEKILYFMIRQKMLTPGIRPYKSENLYEQLEEQEKRLIPSISSGCCNLHTVLQYSAGGINEKPKALFWQTNIVQAGR